jgi:hypothetical protein
MAVRALMGTLNWTLTWYRPAGSQTIEQIADEYTDLFFHGCGSLERRGMYSFEPTEEQQMLAKRWGASRRRTRPAAHEAEETGAGLIN